MSRAYRPHEYRFHRMPVTPKILARGPWDPAEVVASWNSREFEPNRMAIEAADIALDALRRRGSPSHDGLAARLSDFSAGPGLLRLELQPVRWALRLTREHASHSLSILCLVRAADGSWLAGRRAEWRKEARASAGRASCAARTASCSR